MGIKDLNVLLKSVCINVFEEIHLSEYAYKKVAIDTSLFLCKYKAIHGVKWLKAFIELVSCLRKNEIHCVFIYDNGAPPEKDDERAERRAQAAKNIQNVARMDAIMEEYYSTRIITEELQNFYNTIKNKSQQKRLLSKSVEDKFNIDLVIEKIEKMRSNILDISPSDYLLTEELFKILNIPFYPALLEAETACADLCKRGIVDAVLSEDTDVLAYGCPVFLTKIDTRKETTVRICYPEVLESLELTEKEFLDVCIMCGCDYNNRIPKIGSGTAYKLIKKHGSIEEVGRVGIFKKEKIDISCLKHIRTRELFTEYAILELQSIPFCGVPNFEKLEEFIKIHDIDINMSKLKKNFTHNDIIIVEDSDEEIEIEEMEIEEIYDLEE